MVRKVARPALSSVETLEPASVSAKKRSSPPVCAGASSKGALPFARAVSEVLLAITPSPFLAWPPIDAALSTIVYDDSGAERIPAHDPPPNPGNAACPLGPRHDRAGPRARGATARVVRLLRQQGRPDL